MPKMSGGEALVQSLVREGVEVVFGIPGIHMSGIIVALRDEPSIRMITTRHEAGATHMADGYSRASGKPGVPWWSLAPACTTPPPALQPPTPAPHLCS